MHRLPSSFGHVEPRLLHTVATSSAFKKQHLGQGEAFHYRVECKDGILGPQPRKQQVVHRHRVSLLAYHNHNCAMCTPESQLNQAHHNQFTTKSQPDAASSEPTHNQLSAESQPNHNQVTGHCRITADSQPTHSRITAESQPAQSRLAPQSQPDSSQTTAKSQPHHSQLTSGVTASSQPSHSRIAAESQPGHSRITVTTFCPRCLPIYQLFTSVVTQLHDREFIGNTPS